MAWSTVHTGQHYDDGVGVAFATAFGVPCDVHLAPADVDAPRTLSTLIDAVDGWLARARPDTVVVIGDVNSTVAAAVAASGRRIPVIHLEAGLRSGATDPEERNRRLVTACTDLHLAPSRDAVRNLLREGVERDRIHLVGNAMAEAFLARSEHRAASTVHRDLGLRRGEYVCFTAHKPETLCDVDWIVRTLGALGARWPVVFPVHPRTRSALSAEGMTAAHLPGVSVVDPLAYDDLGALVVDARAVVTDSSGLQEEATLAGTACATVVPYTARPETVLNGTNTIVGRDLDRCVDVVASALRPVRWPEHWDDRVSARIAHALAPVVDLPRPTGSLPEARRLA